MEPTWWVLLAGAAVAGCVRGLSGFAFGVVATSIWAWWLPPQTVAVPKDRHDVLQLATAVRAVPRVEIEVVLEYSGQS